MKQKTKENMLIDYILKKNKSHPNQEAICNWCLLAKEKLVVSNGVSLALSITSSAGPLPRSRWSTQNKLHVLWRGLFAFGFGLGEGWDILLGICFDPYFYVLLFSFWKRETEHKVGWEGRWVGSGKNLGMGKYNQIYLIKSVLA